MPIHVEVVAAEHRVLEADVDEILAPTPRGQVGILPRHAPLLTQLTAGEVRLKRGDEETVLAIGGGFMEVADNRAVILADSAERADEIDLARAEAARQKAAESLASRREDIDVERAQLALQRSLARIRAAERVRQRGGRPRPAPSDTGMPGMPVDQ